MKNGANRTVSIWVPVRLWQRARKAARARGLSLSAWVCELIRGAL